METLIFWPLMAEVKEARCREKRQYAEAISTVTLRSIVSLLPSPFSCPSLRHDCSSECLCAVGSACRGGSGVHPDARHAPTRFGARLSPVRTGRKRLDDGAHIDLPLAARLPEAASVSCRSAARARVLSRGKGCTAAIPGGGHYGG